MYGRYPKHRGQQIASGPLRRVVAADQLRPSGSRSRSARAPSRARAATCPGSKVTAGDRRRAQRQVGSRPHQPVQQPRPLLDRGPGPAHRRAEDVEPARQGHREGPGGAGHRHDRHRHRQGGRRHHHHVAATTAAPARPASTPASARACPARSARCSRTTPSPRRASATGWRSGRTAALRTGRRRHEAHLHGRQPARLRHRVDGRHRLHDLPRLPARHLPRGHRHPARRARGPRARPEAVRARGSSTRRWTPSSATSPRWARPSGSWPGEMGVSRGAGAGGPGGPPGAGLPPRPPRPDQPAHPGPSGSSPPRPARPASSGLPPAAAPPGARGGGRAARRGRRPGRRGGVDDRGRPQPRAPTWPASSPAPRRASTTPGSTATSAPAARRGGRRPATAPATPRARRRPANGHGAGNGNGHRPTLVDLAFTKGAAAGSGLAAFTLEGVRIRVFGGAQDGVGKCALGGEIQVLKAQNAARRVGRRPRGQELRLRRPARPVPDPGQRRRPGGHPHVGRRHGARRRAGPTPLNDRLGTLAARANCKGFAFEYMTGRARRRARRPGPVALQRDDRRRGLRAPEPRLGPRRVGRPRRLSKAARSASSPSRSRTRPTIQELLGAYREALRASGQAETADGLAPLIDDPAEHFLTILPVTQQADPNISTE